MSVYELMHKDVRVLSFEIRDGHYVGLCDVHDDCHVPVGCHDMTGYVSDRLFGDWLDRRQVPLGRANYRFVQSNLRGILRMDLMLYNHACNLSDQYWAKPENSTLSYADVNMFGNVFGRDLGDIMIGRSLRVHPRKADLVGPDSASGGNLPKCWKIVNGERLLIKGWSSFFRQEPYNERIGSLLCEAMGVCHVSYRLMRDRDGTYSVCNGFVSSDEDFVPAWDIISDYGYVSKGPIGDLQYYLRFSEKCRVHGVRESVGQSVVVDYLLRNTDRHWSNFGLLRDANTLLYKRAVPMFDFGNSLWHDDIGVDLRRDGRSKMTGMSLFDDLRFVDGVYAPPVQAVYRFPSIVSEVLSQDRAMPRGHRQAIVDGVDRRMDSLLKRFDLGLDRDIFHDREEDCHGFERG